MKNFLQFAIVCFTMILSFGAVFLMVNAGDDLGQANILDMNGTVEEITTPVGYTTRIEKGDQLMNLGQYTLAASEYSLAAQLQEENPQAYERLGQAYTQMQEWEKAEASFEQAVLRAPGNGDYATQYALSLTRTYQFEEARDVLNEVGEGHQEALFYSALLDGFFGEYELAQKKLEKAAEKTGPVQPEDLSNVQFAYDRFNAQQNGQDIFLKALLSEAFIDLELYQLSEELSLQVLNESNDYRDVWVLLGYAQLKTQQYQGAEDAFKQAKRLDSIKPEVHYFLGNAHYFQEEYEQAASAYELALLYGFEPETEVYAKIAESYLFLEEYEASLAAYEHLIKITDGNIDGFIRPVWIALTQLRDLDRALSLSNEAVEAFPKDAMSHNLLAWTHIERGEWEEATNSIEEALRLDPNLAEAHYNKGLIEEHKEANEAALEAYQKALELAEKENPIHEMAQSKIDYLHSIQAEPETQQ